MDEGIESSTLGESSLENPQTLEQIKEQKAILLEQLAQLDKSAASMSELSPEALKENGGQVEALGNKVGGIFSTLAEKLSNIDPDKALFASLMVGIGAAFVNFAGISDLQEHLQFLPEAVTAVLKSPETAQNFLSFVVSGDSSASSVLPALTLPSMDSFMGNTQAYTEVLSERGEGFADMSRAASGMVNIGAAGAIGLGARGIARMLKSIAGAKRKMVNA